MFLPAIFHQNFQAVLAVVSINWLMKMPALIAEWSKLLPSTAPCLSSPPGFNPALYMSESYSYINTSDILHKTKHDFANEDIILFQ